MNEIFHSSVGNLINSQDMTLNSNVDIGSCVAARGKGLERIDCANDDGKNYCCTDPVGLLLNATSRLCCTSEEYADQRWATLTVIRTELILLLTVFMAVVGTLSYVLITSLGISEEDIKASRRVILKVLMKRRLLYKSKTTVRPSAITGLRHLSATVSRSLSGKAGKEANRKRRAPVSRS